jgi:hypothetical protein
MHGFLIVVLGPFGQNFNVVVWPWNLWMPAMAFVLFFRSPEPMLTSAWATWSGKAIGVLVGVMSIFNFFNLWDDNLSASLYSGKTRAAYIFFLNKDAVRRLPPAIQPYVHQSIDRIGIDVFRWTMGDLSVPPYPELRAFRALARGLVVRYGFPENAAILVVTERPGIGEASTSSHRQPIN